MSTGDEIYDELLDARRCIAELEARIEDYHADFYQLKKELAIFKAACDPGKLDHQALKALKQEEVE